MFCLTSSHENARKKEKDDFHPWLNILLTDTESMKKANNDGWTHIFKLINTLTFLLFWLVWSEKAI